MNTPRPLAEQLTQGLEPLGLDPSALSAPLLAYLDLLATWNRAYNLTAIKDPAEMLQKHVLDSLSLVSWLSAAHAQSALFSLADLGSGAGLPGIPLALALPWLRATLIETNGKKARFLRQALRTLDLGERVQVRESRAQALAESGTFDCLVARAFGTLAGILAAAGHLLRPGGWLLAMKGRVPTDEIAGLPAGYRLEQVLPLTVPGLAVERHLIVVCKLAG